MVSARRTSYLLLKSSFASLPETFKSSHLATSVLAFRAEVDGYWKAPALPPRRAPAAKPHHNSALSDSLAGSSRRFFRQASKGRAGRLGSEIPLGAVSGVIFGTIVVDPLDLAPGTPTLKKPNITI